MSISKRIISFTTSAVLAATFVLSTSGCSLREFFNPEDPNVGNIQVDPMDDGVVTNEEWLAMVNDAFGTQGEDGESDLDVAKRYGFVGENEEVDLAAPLSNMFATSTVARASGIVDKNATNEEIVAAAVENGIIGPDSDLTDPSSAAEALDNAQHDWMYRDVEQHEDIQYMDNLIDFKDCSADLFKVTEGAASTGVVMPDAQAEQLKTGSIFILPPTEEHRAGQAVKVQSIIKNGDGTSSIVGYTPQLGEIYDKFEVSGQFDPNLQDIKSLCKDAEITIGNTTEQVSADTADIPEASALGCASDDASIVQTGEINIPTINISVPLTSIAPTVNTDHDTTTTKELTVNATISNIKLTTDFDIDFHLFDLPDVYAYCALDYKTSVSLKASIGTEGSQDADSAYQGLSDADMINAMNGTAFEETVPVVEVPYEVAPAFSVRFVVSFVVTANGYIMVEVSNSHHQGFLVENGNFSTFHEATDPVFDVKVSASVGLLFEFKLSFNFDLVNEGLIALTLRVGPVLEGKGTFYSDMACFDISFYLSLTLSLKFHSLIMKVLHDPKLTLTLLGDDSKNPCRGNGHGELKNGSFSFLDACSRTATTTTAATTNAPSTPVGRLQFDRSYYTLSQGGSLTIGFKTMPAGVSRSDIIWTSSTPGKVTVDANGTITGVAPGSSLITAKTKDGKHYFTCSVSVRAASGNTGSVSRTIPQNESVIYSA